MEKHVQHEAKRFASEVRHVRTGQIKAVGTIAFASIYAQACHESREKAPVFRPFWVEYQRGDGLWLTAERDMQCKTLQEARNLCRALKRYRVVLHKGNGAYQPG